MRLLHSAEPSRGRPFIAVPKIAPAGDAVFVGNGKKQVGWASGLSENSITTARQREMRAYAGTKSREVLLDNGTNFNRATLKAMFAVKTR